MTSKDQTLPRCPYCERPSDSDGGINHVGGCAGLENAGLNRLQLYMLLKRSLPETKAESAPLDYKLPCEVRLPPSASIGKGCTLRTLMCAMKIREGSPDLTFTQFNDEQARAVRAALTNLNRETDDAPCTECNGTGWDRMRERECDCVAEPGDSPEKSEPNPPSAPAAAGEFQTEPSSPSRCPSEGSGPAAVGADSVCAKHGVTLAFEGDVCWACENEEAFR